ncbi:hypothetical protein AMTR_s00007p00268900 [Amborella trichopoda]|uniref:F-box domain-containing protein n=2 Tax=Amborella trichopoda TaxID=13333 RepID=W1P6S2_AMBTC|nr:hypothetical protein AMTR_s00007p00268900 [Amborella trichopoda]
MIMYNMLSCQGAEASPLLSFCPFEFTRRVGFVSDCMLQYMEGTSGKTDSLESTEGRILEDESLDRFSSLPDNILNSILSYLPTKEAVRTSVLSNRWKYMWTGILVLDFDENCFCGKGENSRKREKMVGIVNRVLKLHFGHVERFKLVFYPGKFKSHISRCLQFLQTSGVQELDLDFRGESQEAYAGYGWYELPSCIYDLGSLLVLNLKNCTMGVPLEFKGLKSLKTLCLSDVYISGEQLSILVSKCEVLQNLTVHCCKDIENIKILGPHTQLQSLKIDGCCVTLGELEIDAPNLLSFDFTGWVSGSPMLNVPRLLKATITQSSKNSLDGQNEKWYLEMAMNLSKLVHVESLSLLGFFVKFLAKGEAIDQVPTNFLNLKKLALKVNMTKVSEVTTIARFLGCCHHLEEIVFWLDQHHPELTWQFWDAQVPPYCVVDYLKTVVIKNFSGLEDEEAFVRFLLMCAKELKKITVSCYESMRTERRMQTALEKLAKVERASQNVEMVIDFDSNQDLNGDKYLYDDSTDGLSEYDYGYDYDYDDDDHDYDYDAFEIEDYFSDQDMILNLFLH